MGDRSSDPGDPETLLLERISNLGTRYTRLLALRLAAVIDQIRERGGEAAGDPLFERAWECFGSLRGPVLQRALEEPALEDWIGRVERLIPSPALKACPHHHLPRVVARFTALALYLAGSDGTAAEGGAIIMGGASIPILAGAAEIHPPTARSTFIRWNFDDRLAIRGEEGELLIAWDSTYPYRATVRKGWHVEPARRWKGLRIFTRPRCVSHPEALPEPAYAERLADAWQAASPMTREVIRRVSPALGTECELHPLRATAWIGTESMPSVAALASGVARNLVTRCAAVCSFDRGAPLTEILGRRSEREIVEAVARELSMSEEISEKRVLREVLEACDGDRREPPPSEPAPEDTALPLDFTPVVLRAGLDVIRPRVWLQSKTYLSSRSPDWKVLNALLDLSVEDRENLRTALLGWPESEVRRFGLACLDYFEGDFVAGLGHAKACLEKDADCEEYWFLLALYARQLGHADVFDEIAFDARRGEELVRRLGRAP